MNILNKLTIKHLKMNKKRTIVTIIGIILSTALMVGIGLLASSVRDYMIREIKQMNGNYHTAINYITSDKLDIIKENEYVDRVFFENAIGFSYLPSIENNNKPYLFINSVDSNYLKELKLIKGRMPSNIDEIVISNHLKGESGFEYEIGTILELEIGKRTSNIDSIKNDAYVDGEALDIFKTKKYKVVGVVEKSIYENYDAAGYSIFTINNDISDIDIINTYISYKNPKDVYEKTKNISKNIGMSIEEIDESEATGKIVYNDSLLALYGQSKYDNFNGTMLSMIVITLGLISIGCIVVIYNSFAISVMERKKQFGLFSSIGTTKSQLRKTVFYEAFIVGVIGIILGIISAMFGIWVVIEIINNLLKSIFTFDFNLSIYPMFIILPVLFMVIVIVLSAYIPAKSASRVSPIDAIRQNDDIKIKGKKVKTTKLVRKLFGMEGEIALKNIKRNKRKYRITIASLFISIVLFISFSGFLRYGLSGTEDFMDLPDFDFIASLYDENENVMTKQINEIVANNDIEKYTAVKTYSFLIEKISSKNFTDQYKKILGERDFEYINVVMPDDATYKNYINGLGLTEEKIILINTAKGIIYDKNKRQSYDVEIFKNVNDLSFDLLEYSDSDNKVKKIVKIDDFYVTNKMLFGLNSIISSSIPTIILPSSEKERISFMEQYENNYMNVIINAKDSDSLDRRLKEIKSSNTMNGFHYMNIEEQIKLQRNFILVVKILLYGFISLVTLIGITSVFNTINTSIALRRKEFAVLRSIGLTPNGFNKIIYFESIFFGIKSLFYALPVSFGVVYLIHNSMQDLTYNSNIMFPTSSILLSTIGVFVIVLITMMYASKKIKKENILDAIREENI